MATDIATFEAVIARTINQGGGTFYPNGDPFQPDSGYAVGIGGIILDPATTGAFVLRNAFRKVHRTFGGSLVGTWLDHDKLYVDAVMYFCAQDRDLAIAEGYAHDQEAIFDFEVGDAFYLSQEA